VSNVLIALQMILLLSSGPGLEISGRLVEAGIEYETSGDAEGQMRILCRFLEEALYAGETAHAFYLIQSLEGFPVDDAFLDFWYARLAWSCGLPELACRSLDGISGGPWLESRSRGLAAMYRGDAEGALELFSESWDAAATLRERYYSSIDLCFALLQLGRFDEAAAMSSALVTAFPHEGLPLVAAALCMHGQERYGAAMTTLQNVSGDTLLTGTIRTMADRLMEDME